MRLNPVVKWAPTVALITIACPGWAKAQATSSPSDSSTSAADQQTSVGSDIIVTAQRRKERLVNVPLAVRAITADEIANRGVVDLSEMQSAVPSLRIVDTGVGTQRIRGPVAAPAKWAVLKTQFRSVAKSPQRRP